MSHLPTPSSLSDSGGWTGSSIGSSFASTGTGSVLQHNYRIENRHRLRRRWRRYIVLHTGLWRQVRQL